LARILIVDDSSTSRQQLRVVLESAGHAVAEADDGARGLAEAKRGPFDLIIADVNMPQMNGIDMIREVRKLLMHERTPIFVLTTEGRPDVARSGKAAGANAWIVKPFSAGNLLAAVSKAVR
jgi:two-component system, chemotaxis family, chemotaxis protein CheY